MKKMKKQSKLLSLLMLVALAGGRIEALYDAVEGRIVLK